MSRYNRRSQVSKTFRDYLVPFIGFLLIIILIISFLGGDDNNSNNNISGENKIGIDINLDTETTEAYIEYIGGKNKKIELNETKLYKGEKIIVKNGIVDLDFIGAGKMRLNKMGELKFNENGSFSLFSSDLWINSTSDFKLNLRYGSVDIKKDSVISITQNEAASSVYVLQGMVEVKNQVSKSSVLGQGQKIVISTKDSRNKDIDLKLLKEPIDDFFKGYDWFIKNNGSFYLNEKEDTGTGKLDTDNKNSNSNYISFDSLRDESQVSTSKINIKGKILKKNIGSLSINGVFALIDLENKTFEIKEFSLNNKINDLVIKIYDSSKQLLSKQIFTIYYSGGKEVIESKFKVENFSLDSTKFQFIFPKDNPYTTFTDLVTIEGKVPPGIVGKIQVNGYTLQKFPRSGSYWKYHANKDFGNLKEGLNIYKIEYFGLDGKLLHSNAFSIIKKVKVLEKKKKVFSDEQEIKE